MNIASIYLGYEEIKELKNTVQWFNKDIVNELNDYLENSSDGNYIMNILSDDCIIQLKKRMDGFYVPLLTSRNDDENGVF